MPYFSPALNVTSNTLTFPNPGGGAQNPLPDRVQIQNNSQYYISENIDTSVIPPNSALTVPIPAGLPSSNGNLVINIISYATAAGSISLEWLLPDEEPIVNDGALSPSQAAPLFYQKIINAVISGTTANVTLPLYSTGLVVQSLVQLLSCEGLITGQGFPVVSTPGFFGLYYIPLIAGFDIYQLQFANALIGGIEIYSVTGGINPLTTGNLGTASNPDIVSLLSPSVIATPVANPTAGADWSYTLLAAYRLLAVNMNFVGGSGGTAFSRLVIRQGGSTLWAGILVPSVLANQQANLNAAVGAPFAVVYESATYLNAIAPLPNLMLPAGATISSSTDGAIAGMQYNYITLTLSSV
jgi:hypothetical protein